MIRKATLASAALIASSLLSSPVYAGEPREAPVSIDNVARTASGSIASSRSTTDLTQTIGCEVVVYPSATVTTTYVVCIAISSSGTTAVCSQQLDGWSQGGPLSMITDSSYIKFGWGTDGRCSSLEVQNYSYYPPRKS